MYFNPGDSRKPIRWLVLALIVAAYVIVAKLSFLVTIPPGNISPIFPAAGIAFAVVLLWGRRVLPAVWVGSFAVNLWGFFKGSDDLVATGKAVATAAVIGVGASLGAWVGAWLVRRMSAGGDLLEGGGQVLRLLFFGVVVGGLFSPTFGVGSLYLAGYVPVSELGFTWLTWWVGDTVGCLIMAPCLLAWSMPGASSGGRGRAWEAGLLAVAAGLVCYAAFFRHHPVEYVSLVVLMWAAFRFGIRGVASIALVIAGAATVGTGMGLSTFSSGAGVASSLIMLHSFLGTSVVSALVLAGVLTEHRHDAEGLRAQQDRLEDEVEGRTRELTLLNRLVYDSLDAASVGTWWIDFNEPDTFHALDSTGRILSQAPVAGGDNLYKISEWVRVLHETKIQHPEHAGTIDGTLAHFTDTIEGRVEAYHSVYPMLMPGGKLKWLDARAHVPARSPDGRALTMTGTLIDITQLKLAELELEEHRTRLESLVARRTAELRAGEERFQLAVRAAAIGVWDWDIVRNQLLWDDGMYRLYGVRREDFSGAYEAWTSCIHPEDVRVATDAINAALRGEKEYAPEFRIIRPDGEVRHLQAASQTFRDEAGNAVRMIGTNIDITANKRAEEKLRQSERRFRSFFDQVPIPLSNFRADGTITYSNEAFVKTLGYNDTELRNLDDWWLLAYPDTEYRRWVKESWGESLARAAATRSPLIPQEYSVACKDGTVKPLLIGGVAIGDEFLATFLDLSDRKRAEMRDLHIRLILEKVAAGQALHDTLEFVCRCVETDIPGAIVSIFLVDDDGVRFRFGAAPSLPGFYNEAVDGMYFTYGVGSCGTAVASGRVTIAEDITTHPHWAPFRDVAARAGVRACWSMPIVSASGKTLASFAIYHREPFSPTDADAKDVQLFIESIRITIESDLARREIRDHREHLEELVAMRTAELSKSRSKLETAMAQAHMANWEFDFEADSFVFDDHFYALYGTTAEREGGVRMSSEVYLREFCHPDDAARVIGVRAEVFANKAPVIFRALEHRIIRRDGEVRVIAARYRLVRDTSGKPVEWVGCNQDITEQKQLEADLIRSKDAAEAANRAKSSFLSNMSHELRTPLNAILGYAQIMLRDRPPGSPDIEALRIINRSGEHLLGLINSVLDLSKIESLKYQLAPENFDLGNFVGELVDILHRRAEDKGISLVMDQTSSFPRFVCADRNKLRQILINIVGNAIKFTDTGGVTLHLSTGGPRRADGSGDLVFTVTDTGPGVAPEDYERIFKPFEQAANRPKVEGTGLGLALSREFVRLMGGDVRVTGAPGRGSVFTFNIVYTPVDESGIEKLKTPPLGDITGIEGASGLRILIVEDQRENRMLLKKLLLRYGFEVAEAENGEIGVERTSSWKPHLVLMDRRMPVMDGATATRLIRQLPGGDKLRIAAVTAEAFREDYLTMMSAGCDAFVRKPYKVDELLEVLAELLPVTPVRASSVVAAPEADPEVAARLAFGKLPSEVLIAVRIACDAADTERIVELLAPHKESASAAIPFLNAFRTDRLAALLPE